MSSKRNGLLCLLVLAMLLVAVAWTPASASDRRARSTITGGPVTVKAPKYSPTSGEPDVGGTPSPPRVKASGYEVSVRKDTGATQPWSRLKPWVRLVIGTWSVWFPGLS
jgi:hypothetical protein